MLPENMTSKSAQVFTADFWSERYIRHINYILCSVTVDFVSCDVTVISSLKRFISRFLLPFVHMYFKEFQNVKIIQLLAKIGTYVSS